MSKTKSKTSLADQIAALNNPASSFDPEDASDTGVYKIKLKIHTDFVGKIVHAVALTSYNMDIFVAKR